MSSARLHRAVVSAALLTLAGCAYTPPVQTPVKPTWQPAYTAVDGVVSPALRSFLKTTSSPKVVLRTPSVVNTITAADTAHNPDYDALYGRLERALIGEGFLVRDRALLQSLMSGGMTDYEQIGKRIETDLILEITGIRFGGEEQKSVGYTAADGRAEQALPIQNPLATMDVRVIQVKTGAVGALLSLKVSAWEVGDQSVYVTDRFACPFSSTLDSARAAHIWKRNAGFICGFKGYTWIRGDATAPSYFTEDYFGTDYQKVRIGVPMSKAIDRLSAQLLNRLRGDI